MFLLKRYKKTFAPAGLPALPTAQVGSKNGKIINISSNNLVKLDEDSFFYQKSSEKFW